MDDITSNISITCDMLVTIVRNLIVLSNTSTNVSSDAIKSLLNDLTPNNSPNTYNNNDNSNSNAASNHFGFKSIVDETDLHLYHPLYLNQQLNHYNKSNSPSSFDAKRPASTGGTGFQQTK